VEEKQARKSRSKHPKNQEPLYLFGIGALFIESIRILFFD